MAHTWVDGEVITAEKLNDSNTNIIEFSENGQIYTTINNCVTDILSSNGSYDTINVTVNDTEEYEKIKNISNSSFPIILKIGDLYCTATYLNLKNNNIKVSSEIHHSYNPINNSYDFSIVFSLSILNIDGNNSISIDVSVKKYSEKNDNSSF